jgi:hypothetical protein
MNSSDVDCPALVRHKPALLHFSRYEHVLARSGSSGAVSGRGMKACLALATQCPTMTVADCSHPLNRRHAVAPGHGQPGGLS